MEIQNQIDKLVKENEIQNDVIIVMIEVMKNLNRRIMELKGVIQ